MSQSSDSMRIFSSFLISETRLSTLSQPPPIPRHTPIISRPAALCLCLYSRIRRQPTCRTASLISKPLRSYPDGCVFIRSQLLGQPRVYSPSFVASVQGYFIEPYHMRYLPQPQVLIRNHGLDIQTCQLLAALIRRRVAVLICIDKNRRCVFLSEP